MCEWWMKVEDGAVASWGATRWTYTDEHNLFDEFVYQSFGDTLPGIFRIGDILYWAHAQVIPQGGNAEWNAKQEILFSDPALHVGTGIPESLSAVFPETLDVDTFEFPVQVSSGGLPVGNVWVCLTKDSEVFELGFTNPSGETTLWPAAVTPGTLDVTVSGHGSLPLETSAFVRTPGYPYAIYDRTVVDDDTVGGSQGNGNGVVDAGETVELWVWVRNWGQEDAHGVHGKILCSDTLLIVTDSLVCFGSVPALDSLLSPVPFGLQVQPEAPDGHRAVLDYVSWDTTGSQHADTIRLRVHAPEFAFDGFVVDDEGLPEENGRLDPGEEVPFWITVRNEGSGQGDGVTGYLSVDTLYLSSPDSVGFFGRILPDSTGTHIGDTILVHADSSTPRGTVVSFLLALDAEFGGEGNLTFEHRIGDDPPGSFVLGYPSHGFWVTLPDSAFWQPSIDPDPGDSVIYDAIFSPRIDLSDSTVVESIGTNRCALTDSFLEPGTLHYWTVRAYDLYGVETWAEDTFAFQVCVPGDGNGDGILDLEDVEILVDHLFFGRYPPGPCGDTNGDGVIDIKDLVILSRWIQPEGPSPLERIRSGAGNR
jgi:hypothetical protein